MNHLSSGAESLLRRRLARERIAVTAENRPLFREMVAAGLMEPLSTFLHGTEGNYRPTPAALAWISGDTPASPPLAPAAGVAWRG